MLEQP